MDSDAGEDIDSDIYGATEGGSEIDKGFKILLRLISLVSNLAVSMLDVCIKEK